MTRIYFGAACALIAGACFVLLALSADSQLTRAIVAIGAVVQISYALVLILRPRWVYKDL